MSKAFDWSPEAVTHLVLLWRAGIRTGLIAKRLNASTCQTTCTRRAVIGKAHRLKLPTHLKSLVEAKRPSDKRRSFEDRNPTDDPPKKPPTRRQVTYQIAQEYGEDEVQDIRRQAATGGAL